MFEIESKNPDEIVFTTKKGSIKINSAEGIIDANLPVGTIEGPCEVEIGEASIRGIATASGKTIYDVEIGGIHDLVADILCTSSVRAIRELEPKLIVAMGNVDGMVSDLKLSARTEKKLKVKSLDSLPATKEVVVLC